VKAVELIGMVHLPALPGSPTHDGSAWQDIIRAAQDDARVLEQSGFDAVLIQNSLDRPTRERVDIATVAQLTRAASALRDACSLPIGVNVHKNDGPAGVAVAAAAGATFVRVKVHTGAVISAEGVVTGCAHETLALRRRLGADVAIWADVHDPTSRAITGDNFVDAATDAADFGAADALVITLASLDETLSRIAALREHLPNTPMVIGGKVTHATVRSAMAGSDSIIVGSALKSTPGIAGHVDPAVAADFIAAARP